MKLSALTGVDIGTWVKVFFGACLAVGIFMSGCQAQKGRESAAREALVERIHAKDRALGAAAEALRGSSAALRAQNAANAAAIEEAKADARRETDAGRAADNARRAAEAELEVMRRNRAKASRLEACRILLQTDVWKACGI